MLACSSFFANSVVNRLQLNQICLLAHSRLWNLFIAHDDYAEHARQPNAHVDLESHREQDHVDLCALLAYAKPPPRAVGQISSNFAKCRRARSPLYLSRIFTKKIRCTTFFNIYTICAIIHLWKIHFRKHKTTPPRGFFPKSWQSGCVMW